LLSLPPLPANDFTLSPVKFNNTSQFYLHNLSAVPAPTSATSQCAQLQRKQTAQMAMPMVTRTVLPMAMAAPMAAHTQASSENFP
jgi:hypothetical protein